jgi:competence protein ComEA
MTPRPAKRYDLAWRRRNVAALIVLAILSATGLVLHALSAPRGLGSAPQGLAQRAAAARELIDPNTASRASLDRLPGIGPALADAIVAARETGESFKNANDLQRVSGIGKMKAAAIAPFLTFDSE